MKNLFIVILGLFFTSCGHEAAIRILEEQGYYNVRITNFGNFRCTDVDDPYRTSFVAMKKGKRVEGRICLPALLKPSITREHKIGKNTIEEYWVEEDN